MTVRAMSPISSTARVAGMVPEVSPSASRFIASASPLSGPAMLLPISRLSASPMRTVAMPTLMMMLRVRACDAVSAAHTALLRDLAKRRDFVGDRQHVPRIVVDHRDRRADLVGDLDPLGERVGIGLHLLAELLLHLRRGDGAAKDRLEVLDSSKKTVWIIVVRFSRKSAS